MRYFVAILRLVVIYAIFGKTLGKKSTFLGQNSVSWARSALLHGRRYSGMVSKLLDIAVPLKDIKGCCKCIVGCSHSIL